MFLCKSKEDKNYWKNHRGKRHFRIGIYDVKSSEPLISEKQGGFRKKRGLTDKLFKVSK